MRFQLKHSSMRWASFLGAAAIYIYMLSVSLPKLTSYAGGLAPFDMRPGGYNRQEALQVLQALGPDGRDYYLNHQLVLDIAYPALLALFIWQMLDFIARHHTNWWINFLKRVAWAAPLVMIFDYGENVLIARMLLAENVTVDLVNMASTFSRAKAITTSLFLTLLLAAAMAYGWQRFRKRAKSG
ncbi:hypothetical protein [Maritalea sp. S77]|uniref:hypothetical protein n=1 Tax=Maritalea sp. S77 TaxID=3415125 RepID=UPI003C7D0047